jgi:hypothetical protein
MLLKISCFQLLDVLSGENVAEKLKFILGVLSDFGDKCLAFIGIAERNFSDEKLQILLQYSCIKVLQADFFL